MCLPLYFEAENFVFLHQIICIKLFSDLTFKEEKLQRVHIFLNSQISQIQTTLEWKKYQDLQVYEPDLCVFMHYFHPPIIILCNLSFGLTWH